jgi:DNA-binding protein HU-beta
LHDYQQDHEKRPRRALHHQASRVGNFKINEGLKMNKSEFVSEIADKTGLKKKDSIAALDAVENIIKTELSQGNSIVLLGIGTFSTKEVAAKKGRNPATGEPLDIPAKTKVIFKAAKALKAVVNT